MDCEFTRWFLPLGGTGALAGQYRPFSPLMMVGAFVLPVVGRDRHAVQRVQRPPRGAPIGGISSAQRPLFEYAAHRVDRGIDCAWAKKSELG